MINNNLFIQRFNGVKGTRNNNCYISPLFSERYSLSVYQYDSQVSLYSISVDAGSYAARSDRSLVSDALPIALHSPNRQIFLSQTRYRLRYAARPGKSAWPDRVAQSVARRTLEPGVPVRYLCVFSFCKRQFMSIGENNNKTKVKERKKMILLHSCICGYSY